ncbi:hypothetical protein RJ640_027593 [Escallonia rubra]|uniref:S-acyltransferase n=1 Tax=Escallonia rubra TaxID=112253 RepID=A0AA88R1Z1_9ASTE|nr:hypothetical protein RJ640_027593 [Escallonia rubra]
MVVAITVFCLLVVAFYSFFAPFLGGRIWEYALVVTYSPVALLVFILYVRSTAINPADPGIMFKFDSEVVTESNRKDGLLTKDLPRKFDEHSSAHTSPSSASISSIAAANSSRKGSVGEVGRIDFRAIPPSKTSSCHVGKIFCALFVHEDCRKQDGTAEQEGAIEDALFCTLCNAEGCPMGRGMGMKDGCGYIDPICVRGMGLKDVHIFNQALLGKRLREMPLRGRSDEGVWFGLQCLCLWCGSSANTAGVVINAWTDLTTIVGKLTSLIQLVQWLNNCVGRKNYITFISLMAISVIWLVIEVGVGIAVLVRCFVNKKSMEAEIVDRLGNGFSRVPFAAVVALCTAVSLLACVPLGELFFFHMILIRKGITTYEYVVAMRDMGDEHFEERVEEALANIRYSPTGSATTGYSGGSSLGLQYKGGWCTPPRVFVDYQEEVAPQLDPGMVPSTVDPDAAGFAERGEKLAKRPVRISAWKLAKLDSNKAVRAAAKARETSSVLRPVQNNRLTDSELSSSGNMSVRSSMSTDVGANKDVKSDLRLSPLRNSFAPSQGSRDDYESNTQSVSSFSSPSHVHESVTLSPLPQARGLSQTKAGGSVPSFVPLPSRATISRDQLFHTSSGFDEEILRKRDSTDTSFLSAPAPAPAPAVGLLRDVKKTSVVWDQEAGRYVSVLVSASETRVRPSFLVGASKPDAVSGILDKWPAIAPREPSPTLAKPTALQSEKLLYTGESIFFGGPLFSAPIKDGLTSERASGSRESHERLPMNLPRDSRLKRDAASNQLPVFVPLGPEQNPPSGSGLKKSATGI